MKNKTRNIIMIIGLVSVGIVIGMALSWAFIFSSIDNFTNNILPKIQIENINFNLNETELVKAMNETFRGKE